MELKENLSVKYHLNIHQLSDSYPTDFDIEFDVFMLVVDYNKKKRRKTIKGDLPTNYFQNYYNESAVENQPKILEIFKQLKDNEQLSVNEDTIQVSVEFINNFKKN